ncbi:MAG: hypothetical protein ACJA0N_001169 [Pseudohongiellaceae bacterium]|jgi:hypothetical protein
MSSRGGENFVIQLGPESIAVVMPNVFHGAGPPREGGYPGSLFFLG